MTFLGGVLFLTFSGGVLCDLHLGDESFRSRMEEAGKYQLSTLPELHLSPLVLVPMGHCLEELFCLQKRRHVFCFFFAIWWMDLGSVLNLIYLFALIRQTVFCFREMDRDVS